MEDKISLQKRWNNFRPSKGLLFWACVASAAMTIVVGFTWGGWVTGSSAEYAKDSAIHQSRSELLAAICVDRFVGGENAATRLGDLKKAGMWERRDVIRNGGWVNVTNVSMSTETAATMCAERLLALELPQTAAAK